MRELPDVGTIIFCALRATKEVVEFAAKDIDGDIAIDVGHTGTAVEGFIESFATFKRCDHIAKGGHCVAAAVAIADVQGAAAVFVDHQIDFTDAALCVATAKDIVDEASSNVSACYTVSESWHNRTIAATKHVANTTAIDDDIGVGVNTGCITTAIHLLDGVFITIMDIVRGFIALQRTVIGMITTAIHRLEGCMVQIKRMILYPLQGIRNALKIGISIERIVCRMVDIHPDRAVRRAATVVGRIHFAEDGGTHLIRIGFFKLFRTTDIDLGSAL